MRPVQNSLEKFPMVSAAGFIPVFSEEEKLKKELSYEVNDDSEQDLPFSVSNFPIDFKAVASLFDSATKATSVWKLLQRLKVQYNVQVDAAYKSYWDTFSHTFIVYLLRRARRNDTSEADIRQLADLLKDDVTELLAFRPAVLSRLIALFVISIFRSIEGNEEGISVLLKKTESKKLSKAVSPDAMSAMVEQAHIAEWTDLIDQACEAGTDFINFLGNVKVIYMFLQVVKIPEDDLPFVRSVIPPLFAQRWCLADWCAFPDYPSKEEDGPLPWDSLTGSIDDQILTSQQLLSEWQSVSLAVKILLRLATVHIDKSSSLPEWGRDPIADVIDCGRSPKAFFMPDLLKLGAFAILSSYCLDPPALKMGKADLGHVVAVFEQILKDLQKYLLAVDDRTINLLFQTHWVEPVKSAAEAVDPQFPHLVEAHMTLEADDELIYPLCLWTTTPKGIKQLTPAYEDVSTKEFFEKARSARKYTEEEKEIKQARKARNAERRGVAKEMRRDAAVVAALEARERKQHEIRQEKKRKHFEAVIAQGNEEYKKLRTMSGEAVRTKKSKPVKGGRPQKPKIDKGKNDKPKRRQI